MKQFVCFLLIIIVIPIYACGQIFSRSQKFKIFGIQFRAKDVVGNNRFNDLGIKYFTSVIDDLTDDTTTYLGRLGTIRLNVGDYTDGTISLLNLSTSNHQGGYPLLDSIDFIYYRERGFQIIENKDPTLLLNSTYKAFKDTMCNLSKTVAHRREYLWAESNHDMREKILLSRYFINTQPITDNQKITKKVTAEIKAALKLDVSNLLKSASKVKDSVTNQFIDTVAVGAYFSRTIDRTLDLKGLYLSAVFQNEYINRIRYIVTNMVDTDPLASINDEFDNNLRQYTVDDHVALNSALFAFKFSGALDKTTVSVDSIKADLAALFNIGAKQAGTLAGSANLMFSRHLDEIFHNQFSKVWLIMFGTDEVLDKLKFQNNPTIQKRK